MRSGTGEIGVNMKKMLIESFYLPVQKIEESEGKGHWRAPIWNLDSVNLNGRIYPKELAERIVKESPVTTCNDGHDADFRTGSEYGCAVAVCKNPVIENNQLWVDIEFIDESFKKKLETLVSYGVRIGVSSVGYGECDDSGRIDPESYELVRFADFVTSPAGQVYATIEKEDHRKAEKPKDERDESLDDSLAEAMAERRQKLAGRLVNFIGDFK